MPVLSAGSACCLSFGAARGHQAVVVAGLLSVCGQDVQSLASNLIAAIAIGGQILSADASIGAELVPRQIAAIQQARQILLRDVECVGRFLALFA